MEATDDPARAARRLMTDDGFNIGVLFQGSRPPFPGSTAARASMVPEAQQAVADLEKGFLL